MTKTKFRIVFKKEKWYLPRKKVVIEGSNYYISDNDSSGYSRFVIIDYDNKKKLHKFVCNSHDCLYIDLKNGNEPEKQIF